MATHPHRTTRLRRRLGVLLALIVALTLIGDIIPRIILGTMQTMTVPAAATLNYRPTTAPVLDTAAYHARQLPDAPACTNRTLLACYVRNQPATLTTNVSAAPATEEQTGSASKARKQADVHGHTTLNLGPDITVDLEDNLRLLRNSTFPVPEATATLDITGPGGHAHATSQHQDGLRYRFPYTTEQKSYPYFDPVTGRSFPIDYLAANRNAALSTFLFHQVLDPVAVEHTAGAGSAWHITGMVAPAREVYSDKEISDYGYSPAGSVHLTAYYTASRTLTVEPASGEIVDAHEEIYWFYASDDQQANAMTRAWAEGADPIAARTIVHASFDFDEPTLAAQEALARPVIRTQDTLAVVAWVAKALRLAVIIAAVVTVVRWQRRR